MYRHFYSSGLILQYIKFIFIGYYYYHFFQFAQIKIQHKVITCAATKFAQYFIKIVAKWLLFL